jgi:hypothetical protein
LKLEQPGPGDKSIAHPNPSRAKMTSSTLRDSSWANGSLSQKWQLSLCTFGILALELALIRWSTSQVRVFAYFNNVVLIGAFLGMGIGLALGRRYPGLIHYVLPVLLCASIPLAFSEELKLVHLKMPDPQNVVYMWDSTQRGAGVLELGMGVAYFTLMYLLLITVFVMAGAPVGYLFSRLPNLRAYAWDLAGSLGGVVVFMLVSLVGAGPPAWIMLGGLPFALLLRSRVALVCLLLTAGLAQYSTKGAIFSPYNRIDLWQGADGGYQMFVNRDFHQVMFSFGQADLSRDEQIRAFRNAYELTFSLGRQRDSALVVGAGTGNDVQAARRGGYGRILSVDIDADIIAVGQRHHPDKPYAAPQVLPVVNDARAFFEQYRGPPFDVVCYGILDSHAMFSSMSSLRLDNFVYTKEGIRAAWRHVGPRGHLSLSFAVATPWIADRLYWTIAEATGRAPLCFVNGQYAHTYIVARDESALDWSATQGLTRFTPRLTAAQVGVARDDWPFLYLQPHVFPWIYFCMLCAILLLAIVAVSRSFEGKNLARHFDWAAFCMGAAFLLLQTRGITSMALLVGSTWIVNSAVFFGILSMALVACLVVERWQITRHKPWFFALFATLLVLAYFDLGRLNSLPLFGRITVGGLMLGAPIGLAGIIFPLILRRSPNPAASLGANLLGAVLGGCLEYLSMALGLQMLVFIALFFYVLAMVTFSRPPPAAVDTT